MKKTIVLIPILALITLNICSAQQQGYISGLLSNLKKAEGVEAVNNLGVIKDELLGCLGSHTGSESVCSSIELTKSGKFTYKFEQAPVDGSQAWSIKALPKEGLSSNDSVVLRSSDSGQIVCSAAGVFTGAC